MARALLMQGDQTSRRYGSEDIRLMQELCKKLTIDAECVQGSRIAVNNALVSFLDAVVDDETIIVYYTGHAILQHGKIYLKLGSGNKVNDKLSLSLLVETLSEAQTRNVVLMLDCCSAGAAIKELKVPGRENCALFLASETLGPVKEDEILGASVFTYHLHKVATRETQRLVKKGYYSLAMLSDAVRASIVKSNAVQDSPAPLPVLTALRGHDIRLGNANLRREEDAALMRLTREYVGEFVRCMESCDAWCQSDKSWCYTVVKSDVCMKRFIAPTIREYSADQVRRTKLTTFVKQWLTEDKRYLGMLGEMGIGKTSACLYIAYLLCIDFDEQNGLLPVYIPLSGDLVRRLDKGGVFEVIRNCMGGSFGISDVKRLACQRRLVLLLVTTIGFSR